MNLACFYGSGSRRARQLLEIATEKMAIPLPLSENPVQYDG